MVKTGLICYIDLAMHVAPRLPLSKYELFHTQDVDEARDCVARIFCPHGLHTTAPRRALDARHHSVRLHQDVRLNYVQYGPEVDIDPGYLGDFFLLQIPLRGGAEVRCGGQRVTAHAQMASLPSPSEPLHMRWADDSPHLIVRLSQAAVHRQWEQLVQTPLVKPLVFDLGINLQTPEVSPLVGFIKYLCATLDGQQAFANSVLAAQAETYLLTSLLTLLPHNHTARLNENHGRSVLPRSVWRAQEYMREHVDAPVSLVDLCALTGVSVRSLQTAFQAHAGQSPMAYWRGVRLDGARAMLQSVDAPSAMGIAQIAAKYGFLHLGHFAEHYRLRFGETPTQTLKSVRRRSGPGLR